MATSAEIWQTNMKFRGSRELAWKPKIYSVLLSMIRDACNYPSPESAIQHLDISLSFSKIDLSLTLTELYQDAGRVMGGRAYQQVKKDVAKLLKKKRLIPIGYNEELVNEIIQYFKDHLLDKAVLPITDTMREWILKKLIEGQQKSLSITEIVNDLVKQDFPRNRAFVITRTEVLRAANFGSQQGAKKAGYQLQKFWISAKDFRTRRIPRDQYSHLVMNGVTLNIDEAYHVPARSGGYELLMFPGDPNGSAADVIQCRCTEGYKPVLDANGLPVAV